MTNLSRPFRRRPEDVAAGTEPANLGATTLHSTAQVAPAQPPARHHDDYRDEPARDPAPRRRRSRARRRGNAQAAPEASVPTSRVRLPEAKAPLSAQFRALGVDDTGLAAIAALGFSDPTPIQQQAVPIMFGGSDIVGLAQTGTGKTLAFGLPLARAIDPEVNDVQAVVLVPTRELANQVRAVVGHLGQFYGFTTLGLVGGSKVRTDLARLERGAHVVVGTPGRVIDHLKRGTLRLEGVRFVVLDEADQMLDIGFARDIDYILRTVPKERQTALFSATMPESIGRLVHRYMRKAERVSVTPEQRTAEGVEQLYCEVPERDKLNALRHIYEEHGLGRTLIFRNTKAGVDRLTASLQVAGLSAQAIHGDLRQGQRDRVMSGFRSGDIEFLVATNVAARGLDIPDVDHVINFDVPQNPEEYIHRIGRTARAGRRGSSFTLVGEWDLEGWDAIVREVGRGNLTQLRLPAKLD